MKATDIETKQQTIYMCDNIRQGAIMLQWKGQKHAPSPDDVAYILLFKHIKNQTRYAFTYRPRNRLREREDHSTLHQSSPGAEIR